MQKLIDNIKNINFKQVFTALIVGCLLVVTTACSKSPVAEADAVQSATPASRGYDGYDADQEYKGGMNGYDDDRRYDAENTGKVKALIDTANKRKVDNLGEFVDNVGERAINGETTERALGKFSDKLERNKDKAAEYIDNKSDKLERNLEKVPGGAKRVFDGATDTAQDALEDATKATQKTAKEIKGNFEDLS